MGEDWFRTAREIVLGKGTPMATQDIDKLEQAAREATPGPWEAEPGEGRGAWIMAADGRWTAMSCGESNDEGQANARFIALANPQAILSLIEELERLRAKLRAHEEREERRYDMEDLG